MGPRRPVLQESGESRLLRADMLIDSHTHLTFPDFAKDLDAIIRRAADAGVTRIVTIGTTIESSRRAVELAERFPAVYATVGIHPDHAMEAPEDFIAELRSLAASPRVVGLGEMGLDYYRRTPERIDAERETQRSVFTQQLHLAVELGLNVVIHERESWDETVSVIAPFAGRLRAVFHCFGKSIDHAQSVIAQGHIVSFTGIVTFKNASVVQDTVARLPSGSYMVETDAPYLAPVPFRGKRCEPSHTRATAEHIATLRAESLDVVAAQTTATAQAFFRLPA